MNSQKEEKRRLYAQWWQLSEMKAMDSAGGTYTCRSEVYGECVLKLTEACRELETQFYALQEYAGTRFCHVYERDLSGGTLLLERIVPGSSLRSLPDLNGRLSRFCEVFAGLHRVSSRPEHYPTYLEWVRRITAYIRQAEGELSGYMLQAEALCSELFHKYPQCLLLHGDLHHDNVLLGTGGNYRIIDPKGVLGAAVFDIPRFVLNEFDNGIRTQEDYRYALSYLQNRLGVPYDDLTRLVFIETSMAECWNVQDGLQPNLPWVRFARTCLDSRV